MTKSQLDRRLEHVPWETKVRVQDIDGRITRVRGVRVERDPATGEEYVVIEAGFQW